jgi:hypothetical protein
MKNKDTNKKAKSRDEDIENLREEHKQSLGRILEFIEPKIKDISGSTPIV